MNLADVLLHPDEYDGATVLEPWRFLTGDEFEVLHVTVLANYFLIDRTERIWLLDSWGGELHGVSESYSEYRHRVNSNAEFFDSWFMAPLIEKLRGHGLVRLPKHVFAPFVSPALGGSLEAENFSVAPIAAYAATSAIEASSK
jgi:hypothetical protein